MNADCISFRGRRGGVSRCLGAFTVALVLLVCAPVSVPAKDPCCGNSREVGQSGKPKDELFVADLTCEHACADGKTGVTEVAREFRPLAHGLWPGDGSDGMSAPWGAMTGTIEAWSRFTCLEYAASCCGSLLEVESSRFVELSSGDWSLDHRVSCPTEEEISLIEAKNRDPSAVLPGFTAVISPFAGASGSVRSKKDLSPADARLPVPDPGAVLNRPEDRPTMRRVDTFDYWAHRAISNLEVPDSLESDDEIRGFLLHATGTDSIGEYIVHMQAENGISPPTPCASIVRGRACYGDCLKFPEGLPTEQYMATNELSLENHGGFSVCGDNLAVFYADHPMSATSRQVYCEQYVMASLVDGKAHATTCSSYRIRVDCSDLE